MNRPELTEAAMPFVHPIFRKSDLSRIVRLLAVICIGGLAAGVSPALGAFPGANGKIAFDSDRHGGDTDIWTMNPSGSNLDNLTPNADGEDAQANWRADGRKIVFVSNRETPSNPTVPGLEAPDFEVFVMNADGSRQTQITFNELDDENAAWSPDGRIVFQRDFDPVPGEVDYDILTMTAEGTREVNLTNSPGVIDWQPNWSPNGRQIVFASAPDAASNNDIYKMRPDGSDRIQLTADALDNEFPNWSPDGTRIAFNSNRDENYEVYTMRAGGGDVTRLTFNNAGDGLPAWSPNGHRIAFGSNRAGSSDIHTMRADGRHQVNVTNRDAFDFAADWQPRTDHSDAVSVVANPVAHSAPPSDGQLIPGAKRLAGLTGGQLIGEETRLLLELPAAENPIAGAGESCFPTGHRGKVLILWTRPEDQAPAECIVKPGTSVFLFGAWAFCDEVEQPPYFAVGEKAQRRCAIEGLQTLLGFDAILVTIDGRRPVDIARERFLAISPQGTAQLPEDNILGVAPQETTFVTAGYVAMLRPLRPGEHTITVEVVGGPYAGINSATVNVVPGA